MQSRPSRLPQVNSKVKISDTIQALAPGSRILKKWTFEVNNILAEAPEERINPARERHLFARVNSNQFAVVFDLNQQGMTFQEALEASEQIKVLADKTLTTPLYGALVLRDKQLTSVDHYLKRVQFALQKALEQRSFGTQLREVNSGVM